MSRSYRKPWVKDKGLKSFHQGRVRANTRIVIRKWQVYTMPEWSESWLWSKFGFEDSHLLFEAAEPEFSHDFLLTHPYDICDWRFFDGTDCRSYRK